MFHRVHFHLVITNKAVYALHLYVVLEPYKYAGYPMLIKTITMETQDDTLFSKAAPLLSAATELCYHTVNCSALNAEELRRERGIEVSSARHIYHYFFYLCQYNFCGMSVVFT